MPDEEKKRLLDMAASLGITTDEFVQASFRYAMDHPEESEREAKLQQIQKANALGIRLVKMYPVYQSETDAQALRRAKEEERQGRQSDVWHGTKDCHGFWRWSERSKARNYESRLFSSGGRADMPSKLIYDESNWLFKDPQKNTIHDITIEDINQLLNYAEQDNAWAEAVKHEVVEREKAIRSGTYTKKTDWLLEEFQIMQTSGTVIHMPFGLRIITFPSKWQLFRGEIQNYHRSIPSLNRLLKDYMDEKEKELNRVIAHLRKWQFGNLIWNINIVPYWEAKLSDVNLDALAQHYGFATHLMDLTNDFKAALFFATCKYVPEIHQRK